MHRDPKGLIHGKVQIVSMHYLRPPFRAEERECLVKRWCRVGGFGGWVNTDAASLLKVADQEEQQVSSNTIHMNSNIFPLCRSL